MTMWPRLPRGAVDAPIEGAADPGMTVLRLLGEMRRVRAKDSQWYKDAEIRERIVLGEQIQEQDPTLTQIVGAPLDLRAPIHENVTLPAIQTLVARVDQGRIDSKAWPHTPTPARIAAAEGANLYLDSERARERRDQKVHESLLWALIHGESGIYTTWDDAYGPIEAIEPQLDPNDGLPLFDPNGMPLTQIVEEYGAVRREILSSFDFWTSGEDEQDDVRWQVRRRIVDKWTAQKSLRAAGIERDPGEKSFAVRGNDRRRTGVEVLEMWVKPCAMVEPGLFALVVDDCCVKSMVFPFRHKRLPISVLSCMRVSDSPHGHTVVKDGISQQRLINVALKSILRRADIAGDARLIGPDEIVDAIDADREGLVRYNGKRAWKDASGWLVGAEVPSDLFQVYALAKSALQDVIGVSSESVTGGDPSSTSSGEQLKTAAALDSQKTVPLRRRAEYAWEEADRQGLELFRERATKPRLASVAGSPVRAMYLQGADLDGVDVALESASGLQQSHLGQTRATEEGAAAGYVDPANAGELRQTGLSQTVLDAEQQQRIERQGADALRGTVQSPIPGIDGAAAARTLRLMLAKAPSGRTALLLRLIAEYEQMQPMMAPQPPMQGPGMPKPALTASTKNAIEQQMPNGAVQ